MMRSRQQNRWDSIHQAFQDAPFVTQSTLDKRHEALLEESTKTQQSFHIDIDSTKNTSQPAWDFEIPLTGITTWENRDDGHFQVRSVRYKVNRVGGVAPAAFPIDVFFQLPSDNRWEQNATGTRWQNSFIAFKASGGLVGTTGAGPFTDFYEYHFYDGQPLIAFGAPPTSIRVVTFNRLTGALFGSNLLSIDITTTFQFLQ